MPFLDVFGKAGSRAGNSNGSKHQARAAELFFCFSDKGTEFAWGAGGQAHFGNIGGRLEYENFSIPNTSDAPDLLARGDPELVLGFVAQAIQVVDQTYDLKRYFF